MKTKALLILLLLSLVFTCACDKTPDKAGILICGDISEVQMSVTIEYSSPTRYYNLSNVLSYTDMFSNDYKVLVTGTNGDAVVIDKECVPLCSVYIRKNGNTSIYAPDLPLFANIIDIEDITVICTGERSAGIPRVNTNSSTTSYLSLGSVRLMMYDFVTSSTTNGNLAYKYSRKTNEISLSAILTDNEKCLLYTASGDILKLSDVKDKDKNLLRWEDCRLKYVGSENGKTDIVSGIITDTHATICDAYNDMKTSIDQNNKLLVVLIKGLSYEQADIYKNDLNLLGKNYSKVMSVYPMTSNVALASIITGKAPIDTKVTDAAVKELSTENIFTYAQSKGVNVSYIEGKEAPLTGLNAVLCDDDEGIQNAALSAVKSGDGLVFAHFQELDAVNTQYSPSSSEAKTKLIATEAYIQELIDNFSGRVIIMSDYGYTVMTLDEKLSGTHDYFRYGIMSTPYYCFDK